MDYSNYFKYNRNEEKEPEAGQAEDDSATTTTRSGRMKSLLIVLLAGVLIIIYVSNVLEVKSLLKEIYTARKLNDNLRDGNNLLKMKINQLESADRITGIAKEKFGMIKPEYPPQSLPQNKNSNK